MKREIVLLTVFATVLFASCSPKVTNSLAFSKPPLESVDEVVVIEQDMAAPANAQMLGSIKVGDSGFTSAANGTYDKVIAILKSQARLYGGNVIKITSHQAPDLISNIHRVSADVYYVEDFSPSPSVTPAYEPAPLLAPAGPKTVEGPKVRFAVQGGYTYRLGKVDESLGQDLVEYQKKSKHGLNKAAEVTIFLSKGYSLGLKYSKANTYVSAQGTFSYEDGTTKSGTLSDDIDITFIGPYWGASTVGDGRKSVFAFNIGMGYVGFKDDARAVDPFSYSGWTLGYYLAFQYDYMITKTLSIGVEASAVTGSIDRLNYTENGKTATIKLDKDNLHSVGHVNASVGLRLFL